MTDLQLIELIKNNSSASLIELIARHEKLYFSIILKYPSIHGFDFNGEKFLFFYKVAQDFDPTRGMKFSSFLAERTKFLCKTLISRPIREVELNTDFCNDDSELDFTEELSLLRKRISQIKDVRARKILLSRYFNKSRKVMSFAKIAEITNMSPRNVKYVHDRYIDTIRKVSQYA